MIRWTHDAHDDLFSRMSPPEDLPENLLAALLSSGVACVAVTGAGGKTSLIESLAARLNQSGRPVVISTTTHMRAPEHPILTHGATDAALRGALSKALPGPFPVIIGSAVDPAANKLIGLAPDAMDRLAALLFAATDAVLLIEADGAVMRPLKAHAPHEPVIPACAGMVVAVAGLAAISRPFAVAVHRPELAARILGLSSTEAPVEPHHIAALLLRPEGPFRNAPARRAIVLNTQGEATLEALARPCAAAIHALDPAVPIFAGPCRFPLR